MTERGATSDHWGSHDYLLGSEKHRPFVSLHYCVAKRALDIAAGCVGCLVALLMLPFVGIAIYIEDKGPIFFRQSFRDGIDSDAYYFKFRSMRANAAELLVTDMELQKAFAENYKLKEDPRITRVGKILRRYSIDEFPEFLAVLLGTLSMVGPRTLSKVESERYGPALEKVLSVKAGLTGFWQVMGRQNTTYEERIAMDLFYLEHISIWLDLLIVFRTFWTIIKADGAY
jgi:lipopolysaccharide/colanic/teichoic acid biosynthesis glycosyltransferase